MSTEPLHTTPDAQLAVVHEQMRAQGLRQIPLVGDDGKFLGMVALCDIEDAMAKPHAAVTRHGILALATMGMPVVSAETPIETAWAMLADQPGLYSLPVISHGRLEGIVTQHSLLRAMGGLPHKPSKPPGFRPAAYNTLPFPTI